jgi:DNA-binding transcriptional ArsR family regulator
MNDAEGGNDVAVQLRYIAAYLIEMAERSQGGDQPSYRSAIPLRQTVEAHDLPALAGLAQEELRERSRRNAAFDVELFGEPVWDILLDLFVARVCGRKISVTSACIASNVPPTTALRWLGVLTDGGLVKRESDEYDQRRSWVFLSDETFWSLASYFRVRLAQRDAQLIGVGRARPFLDNVP